MKDQRLLLTGIVGFASLAALGLATGLVGDGRVIGALLLALMLPALWLLNKPGTREVQEHAPVESPQAAIEAVPMATEVVRLKTEFLTQMGQHVRPPLNNMLGMTALVLRSPRLEAQDRTFLQSAHTSATTLLAVVDDILDLSRLEAGEMPLNEESFNTRQLIADVADVASAAAQINNVEVVTSILPEVPSVLFGDSERIRQILVNLVSNAVTHTTKGQISIRLRVLEKTAESGRFRYEVEDTGIGIKKQEQSKLFQPFARINGSQIRERTGLGLAVCKHITEKMGATFGFESEYGKGSTFWFEVPLGISPVSVRQVPLQRRRILLADGNATVRKVLREHLEHWGLECVDAVDMPEVVAASENAGRTHAPFDVAILAAEVLAEAPERLLEALRTQPGQHGLPLILLSHPTTVAAPVDATFCLRKPLRTSELYNALAHLFLVGKRGASKSGAFERSQATDGRFELLVVEDNPINQLVATEIIEELGHRATLADSGEEALALLQKQHFDAVLMDCQLPHMDGYETTRRIRELLSPVAKIPIFALTAHALVGERALVLGAGMDDYLSKPLSDQALSRLLKLWLPGQRSHLPLIDTTVRRSSKAIELFASTIGKQVDAMAKAIKDGDVPQFREWAHRAKGSCLAIGAERLAYTCKELQELGDQGASRGFAEELLGVAKDEVDLTLAELMHLGPSVSLMSPPRTSFTPDRASFTPDRASYSPERISIKPSYSPRIRSTDQA
ncbi:MAG: response regulator [Polyangiaceae bacterium]|nr:response regulator [Polyangiaceae bacterium]